MDNAQKYSFFNWPVVIEILQKSGMIQISVADTGHPTPKELGNQTYDTGMHLDRSDPLRSIHGTGLGLAIVKKIVEAHHGRVFHRCTPLEVSYSHGIQPHRVTFVMELPMKRGK